MLGCIYTDRHSCRLHFRQDSFSAPPGSVARVIGRPTTR